ncbi:hypothetical protein LTR36_004411 [Oleoguttula mirabilis]|uniref:Uncharacterized protein n=1 Tax=Oleoguttula mirabilis TaxID=1507867 RepID=A0AAV9JFV1_9PEZI|nr:hypothetical protein LTR36_004411 [Oleoguttula mirabilis]
MSSSSTRSTWLEQQLHWYFKHVYHRLSQANVPNECNFILEQFANLLDISESDLVGTLQLRYTTGMDLDAYKKEVLSLRALKAEIAKQKQSGKLYEAAKCLANVGAELYKVGRGEEARDWCEWGAELEGVGWKIWEQERRWASSHGLS